jgi:hypothetical protein
MSALVPSGSGWGPAELDKFCFKHQPKSFPLVDFPWQDLFLNQDGDPIANTCLLIEELFGPAGASCASGCSWGTSVFYKSLEQLTGHPMSSETPNIIQRRSKGIKYSSSPPTPAAGSGLRDWPWEQSPGASFRNTSRLLGLIRSKSTMAESHSSLPTQSPKAELDPFSETPRSENQFAMQPASLSPLVVGVGTTILNSHFDSSPGQTDSYRDGNASSESTPKAEAQCFDKDQVEESTNFMMSVLLGVICEIVQTEYKENGITFGSSTEKDALKIPMGVGYFATTIPDLKVILKKNDKEMTILDYEVNPIFAMLMYDKRRSDMKQGKRLKPGITQTGKFAQHVAHIIGRANHNRATLATKTRTVIEILN